MLSHKLEKLKAEQTATIYPPITALEYGNIKNELKDTMLKIKAEKYKKLLKVLDQGQEVIHELEAAIKEYNSTHQELQYLINGSEMIPKVMNIAYSGLLIHFPLISG